MAHQLSLKSSRDIIYPNKMKKTYKNIVVSGDVGTGTSTLAQGLAKKLGWKYLTVGDIFRDYHKKHKIPLWNKLALPDKLDKSVDRDFFEKMKKNKHIVFDGHYLGWFSKKLTYVYKILLVSDKKVATQRILEREHTHKEKAKEIEERRRQLRKKFRKLYSNDNYEDPKIFHLVIDTTNLSIEQTIQKALKAHRSVNQRPKN